VRASFADVAIAAALFALAAAGCASTTREEIQRGVAAEVLACPGDRIEMTPVAGETRMARGCGREKMLTCASFPSGEHCFPMQDLQARASFELDCHEPPVTIRALDALGHTVGVDACDQRAVYQYVSVGGHYDWVLSSRVPRAGQ
jgi:hypothetical protein